MVDKVTVPYLWEIITLLLAAVTIAPLFKKIKLSPVLGYLTAGAVVGPFALGYVNDLTRIQNVAELGVVFLLFVIGLELPIERLKVMRRFVFGLGALQVVLTMLVISGLAMIIGFDIAPALVIGGALSLSSTALVVQLLSERGELNQQHGRKVFSILLFQDLAVVPLLTMTILLGAADEGNVLVTIVTALGKAILAIGGIVLFGFYALRPIYKFFSDIDNHELFTAATMLIVLGLSAVTGYLGLSMALGAFLAGMMIAETEYRHQVERDILPFQGLLLGLFFMSIGMMIDFTILVEQARTIIIGIFGLMLLKGVLVYALAKGYGLSNVVSFRGAVLLAQGGEFAFVIIKVAMGNALLDSQTSQTILIMVTMSMALTPIFVALATKLVCSGTGATSIALDKLSARTADLQNHIIIAGFGRVGKTVATILSAQNVPHVALDLDQKHVDEAEKGDLPVYNGNACDLATLEAVGADRAAAAVITIDAPKAAREVMALLQKNFPHLQVFVRAKDEVDAQELMALGAAGCVPEVMGSSVELGKLVSRTYQQYTDRNQQFQLPKTKKKE